MITNNPRPVDDEGPSALAPAGSPLHIFAWRKKRGLTQEQLAERAGMSTSSINQIQNGHQNPSIKNLGAIAAALDIEPGDLFFPPERAGRPLSTAEIDLLEAVRGLDEDEIRRATIALRSLIDIERRRP